MFGVDAILGLVTPFLPYLLGALAVIGAYFGVKAKGRAEGKESERRAEQAARDALQGRVDDARRSDAAVDQATAAEVAKAQPPPAKPEPPVKPGDVFTFCLVPFLAVLLLTGCPKISPVTPVFIDLPPAPILSACPDAPHPDGRVIDVQGERFVVMALADAVAMRDYLRSAPGCWAAREAQLNGYAQKLQNRIRAVSPGK